MLTVLQDAWPFPEASAHESRANMKAPSTARKDTLGQVAAVLFVFTVLFAAPALAESPVGVCGRTPQVRDALLAGVQANNATVADCSQVTTAHLQALNGTMDLSNRGITSLKSGDLTDLTNLVTVFLSGNALTGLPDGIFASMTNLQELYLYDNDLATLPAGVFDGLTALTTLSLSQNSLTTLPAGVFEGLNVLTTLYLASNPGVPFASAAVALPDDGTVPAAGGTATLDGSGSGGAWGANVTHSWALTAPASGVTVTFDDARSATPTVTVPALTAGTELTFTLTVTGRGGSFIATATATVTATDPTNATLSGLELSGVTFDQTFTPTTETYTATVENIVMQTTVTATPADSDAMVAFQDAAGAALVDADDATTGLQVALSVGDTVIKAVVTAEDGSTTQTYTVTVMRAANTPATGAPTITGTAQVGETLSADADGTSNEMSIGTDSSTYVPVAADVGKTIKVKVSFIADANNDEGPLTSAETAVVVAAASTDATLSALTLSDVTLAPVFASDQDTYTAMVANAVMQTTVTATPADSGATVAFQDGSGTALTDTDTNTVGLQVALDLGDDTVIKAVVTAEDGSTTQTYTVTVTREAAEIPVTIPAEQVWSGNVTAGTWGNALGNGNASGYGYSSYHNAGSILQQTFTYRDTAYTIHAIAIARIGNGDPFHVTLRINPGFPSCYQQRLSLSGLSKKLRLSGANLGVWFDGTPTYNWRENTVAWPVGRQQYWELILDPTAPDAPIVAAINGENQVMLHWTTPCDGGTDITGYEYREKVRNGAFGTWTSIPNSAAGEMNATSYTVTPRNNPSEYTFEVRAVNALGDGKISDEAMVINPSGPICERTAAVRDAILDQIPSVSDCANATPAHLAAIGTLRLGFRSITTLATGDFDGLTALTTLYLSNNELATLPAEVFEPLTALTELRLLGNPGAPFSATADALPDDGTVSPAGGTVTLDGSGSGGPWGTNVTYSWALTDPASGVTVTFDDAASAEPVVTIPALTNGDELTFTLTVTGRGGSSSQGADPGTDTATVTAFDSTAGICGRTEVVRGAILDEIPGVIDCANVTAAHLAAITGLTLKNKNITAIAAGDFDGLTSLTLLDLGDNALTTLPAGVFDDLTALTLLWLTNNPLTTLSAGVFDELTALTQLYLYGNDLTTLTVGVFDGLTALTVLWLNHNALTTLPAGVFDELTALTNLKLHNNALTALPAGVFDDLTVLTTLTLSSNDLATLPAGVFDELTVLVALGLNDNELPTLSAGVFEKLTSLTTLKLQDNPGDPFSATAVALPDDGTVPVAGGMVTLDGSGSGGPWGTNVTYSWALTNPASGVTVTFDDAASAEPIATIPALTDGDELTFTLTVTGRGGSSSRGADPGADTAKVTATDLTDATLSGLELGGVTFDQTFTPATDTYTATVENAVMQTTVTATPADSNATVAFQDGNGAALVDADDVTTGLQVVLSVGDTVIKAVVAAEDGSTTQTYTVTVTRAAPALIPVTIAAEHTSIGGGIEPLKYTLTRTGDTADALTVTVTLTQVETWLLESSLTQTVAFGAGVTEKELAIPAWRFSAQPRPTVSGGLTAEVSGAGVEGGSVTVEVIAIDGMPVTVEFDKTAYSFPEGGLAEDVNIYATATLDQAFPRAPAGFRIGAKTTGDTAESAVDYMLINSENLQFAAADFEKNSEDALVASLLANPDATDGRLVVLDDDIYEGDENLGVDLFMGATTLWWLHLKAPDETTCSGPGCEITVPVTITDAGDLPELELTATPESIAEEDDATTTGTAENVSTVTASIASANTKTIEADQVLTLTFDGSATYGTHYTVSPEDADTNEVGHQVTLLKDQSSVAVTVTAVANDTGDGDRDITVGGTRGGDQFGDKVIITLPDDDTANTPATGVPTITGTAQVGQTLSANTDGITDADGITGATFNYQWVRVDGSNETDISGATDTTYTLVAADLGKTIKVKVSFTDDASNDEGPLASAATAVVVAAPPPGICGRTEGVRNGILARISSISDCADVTAAHLAAITGLLSVSGQSITALAAGDFDGLTSVTTLYLYENSLTTLPAGVFDDLTALMQLNLRDNALATLPAGVFDELTALTTLYLNDNALTTLPAEVFDKLTALTTLYLNDNALTTLPAEVFDELTALTELRLNDNALTELSDGVFDELTALTTLKLEGNPGVPFAPTAVALPDDGTVPVAGGTVTLDGSDSDGGPWGTNVIYGWALTDPASGVTVTFDDDTSATPTVTVPALTAGTELTFTLTVTGRGASGISTGLAPGTDNAKVTAMVVDTIAPTVTSIVRQTPSASPTNADDLTWRVTFSEALANVDTADFVIAGTTATPTAAAVPGSSLAYDVTASGGDLGSLDATVTLSFVASQNIADPAGNALTNTTPTGANDNTFVVDNTAPTVTITGVSATSMAAFMATFTFSEGMDGFAVEDIAVGNATASAFTGLDGGTVFTALITPTADGAVTVDVAAGVATDAAGNGNAAATRVSSTYTAPTGICERTAAVRDAILDQIPGVSDCALVTDEQLAAITGELDLSGESITALAAGDFDGLTALTRLNLGINTLTTLPAGVFDELTALTLLYLYNNELTALPAGVFDGLTALTFLGLYNNSLATLPAGVFDGLTALTGLNLRRNTLTTLPAGVFDELTALTDLRLLDNPGAPFSATADALPDDGTVSPAGGTVTLDGSGSGGPWGTNVTYSWALTDPASGVTVTFDDAASAEPVVTIPALTNGDELTFTLTVTGRGGSSGQGADPGTDTATVTAFDSTAGICGRTEVVRGAILDEIPGVIDCANVTAAHLAAITGLTLKNKNITAIAAGDFDGLTSLTLLDLGDNALTTLPAEVFDDLTALTLLWLTNNPLTTLSAGVFDELTALTQLYLYGNDLTTLTVGVFDGLTALTVLWLNHNALTTLPAGVFDELTALTDLRLHNNALTALPARVFDELTVLTTLTLSSNDLATLPAGVFDGLTVLTELYLYNNELTALPARVFDDLTALQSLGLENNDLTALPAGVFDELTVLVALGLNDNELPTLSAGVFEKLTSLTTLKLQDNPGDPFSATAVALPDDGTVPVAGGMVTLDGSGSGGPWGTNVTYSWVLTNPASGVTVTFDDAASAEPIATIPALTDGDELTFTLTVTGRGGSSSRGADPGADTAKVTAMVVDTIAPTVTSIVRQTPSASPTNADDLTWRVTFSEDVANVDAADFTVSNTTATPTADAVPGSSLAYEVTAAGGDLGSLDATVTLSFAASHNITDAAGNALADTAPTSTNDNTFVLDNTAPGVASIERQTPTASPTNADELIWRVTFSEAVANVDTADFAIAGTTATLTAAAVPGSSLAYDVTASGGDLRSLNATVTLAFATDQNIEDAAGTALTNTAPTGANDNTFVLDNTAPGVASIERQTPTASPTNADELIWRVTFSEAVANVDTADFAIAGTTATLTAAAVPGSSLAYDVTASGGDLRSLNATVTLAFATDQNIEDAAGTALTNTAPTGANDNTFVVDNTAPTVTSVMRQTPTTSPTDADELTWRVTFSEEVANVDSADFEVSDTTAALTATAVQGSSLAWDVKASGGNLADLNATVTLAFATDQNIEDAASNALTNTTPTGANDNTFVVDNTAPTVTSILRQTPTASPTNADDLTWRVTWRTSARRWRTWTRRISR